MIDGIKIKEVYTSVFFDRRFCTKIRIEEIFDTRIGTVSYFFASCKNKIFTVLSVCYKSIYGCGIDTVNNRCGIKVRNDIFPA